MILIDYSGTAISAITAQGLENIESLPIARDKILGSIKTITRNFKKTHGDVVICVDDHKNSWRKDYFPYYKENRKKIRDDSGFNWSAIYENMDAVLQEIRENFHYKVIRSDRAEADDVMAVLALSNDEKHVIVSKDKDMVQLTERENIQVYSPLTGTFMIQPDLDYHVFKHIVKGDSSDGVTNILSDDDTIITEGKKQKPVSEKNLQRWYVERVEFMKEHGEKFLRNKKIISLFEIPEEIKSNIMKDYEAYQTNPRTNILGYLAKNGLTEMASRAGDF